MLPLRRVPVGEAGSSLPAPCLSVASPACLTCPVCSSLLQVLDSLLAQYGTVENVEQGKRVWQGPCLCRCPSAAAQLFPQQGIPRSETWFPPLIGTGLKQFSLQPRALLAEVGPPIWWCHGVDHQSGVASPGHWQIENAIVLASRDEPSVLFVVFGWISDVWLCILRVEGDRIEP